MPNFITREVYYFHIKGIRVDCDSDSSEHHLHYENGVWLFAGGLYEATAAPQGRAGSATDVMSPAKLRLTGVGE